MNAESLDRQPVSRIVAVGGCAACWLWILVNFIDSNNVEILNGSHGSLAEVYAFVAAMFVGSFGLARLLATGRPARFERILCCLTTLALLLFVVYGPARHALIAVTEVSILATALVCMLITAIMVGVWALARHARFRLALSVFALVASSIPAGTLLVHIGSYAMDGERSAVASPGSPVTDRAPDSGRESFYYIITDAYARADVLAELLSYDNSAFLQAMKDRGFFVAAQARSNYTTTDLAVMSLLEMDYLVTDDSPSYAKWRRFYPAALNTGAVPRALAIFRSMGYQTVRVSNDWAGCYDSGFSECYVGDRSRYNRLYTYALGSFLRNTPLTQILNFVNKQTQPDATLEAIPAIERFLESRHADNPLFLFAHHFPPHPPYKFHADCSSKEGSQDDDFSADAAMDFYRDAVSCTNRMILSVVDKIIARDPAAVIVIQSDHGSGFQWNRMLPLAELGARAIRERGAILNLIRVPERCRKFLYPEISNVNTMRLGVGCIRHADPGFLEERSFFNVYNGNPDFGKVRRVH